MPAGSLLALILIFLGGVAIAVQAPINTALGRSIGSGLSAAAVSFGVGFAALVVVSLATSGAAPFTKAAGVPLWQLAGGLLGAFYVWSVIYGLSGLGVLTALVALILGQLGGALVLDHIGAFGLATQPVSFRRVIAVGLVAAGLLLSRS
ncbi:DMT family transporter [Defluviimonas sp. SAOS-178_SWC]|uniref:DMT family transporter n=1 Tax=Defluviimonas sp. SAOS-178_SWC TaxID=3121287 RepID=UPI003221F38C